MSSPSSGAGSIDSQNPFNFFFSNLLPGCLPRTLMLGSEENRMEDGVWDVIRGACTMRWFQLLYEGFLPVVPQRPLNLEE